MCAALAVFYSVQCAFLCVQQITGLLKSLLAICWWKCEMILAWYRDNWVLKSKQCEHLPEAIVLRLVRSRKATHVLDINQTYLYPTSLIQCDVIVQLGETLRCMLRFSACTARWISAVVLTAVVISCRCDDTFYWWAGYWAWTCPS